MVVLTNFFCSVKSDDMKLLHLLAEDEDRDFQEDLGCINSRGDKFKLVTYILKSTFCYYLFA